MSAAHRSYMPSEGAARTIARTAHTASIKYPGFYAMLQNIAPGLKNGVTW